MGDEEAAHDHEGGSGGNRENSSSATATTIDATASSSNYGSSLPPPTPPDATTTTAALTGTHHMHHDATAFKCNICLCTAADPVVTVCGHLYCWPCIYTWLHFHSKLHQCPVCKGATSESRLIPIYNTTTGGGGCDHGHPPINAAQNNTTTAASVAIPPRPRARRLESRRPPLAVSSGRHQQLVQFTPAHHLPSAAAALRRHHRLDSPPLPTPMMSISSHRQMIDALLPVANQLLNGAEPSSVAAEQQHSEGTATATATTTTITTTTTTTAASLGDRCNDMVRHPMIIENEGNTVAATATGIPAGTVGSRSSSSMVDYYVMVGRETRAAWMERLRAMREERLAWPMAFVQGITSRELLQQRRQAAATISAAAIAKSSSSSSCSSMSSSAASSPVSVAAIADHLNLSPRVSIAAAPLQLPSVLLQQGPINGGGTASMSAISSATSNHADDDSAAGLPAPVDPRRNHINNPAPICSNDRSCRPAASPATGPTRMQATQRRRAARVDGQGLSSSAHHAVQYLSTMSSILSSMEVFARALQLSATSANSLASTSEATPSHHLRLASSRDLVPVQHSVCSEQKQQQQDRVRPSEQERFWQSAVRGLLSKMERLMHQLESIEAQETTAAVPETRASAKKERRGGAVLSGSGRPETDGNGWRREKQNYLVLKKNREKMILRSDEMAELV